MLQKAKELLQRFLKSEPSPDKAKAIATTIEIIKDEIEYQDNVGAIIESDWYPM